MQNPVRFSNTDSLAHVDVETKNTNETRGGEGGVVLVLCWFLCLFSMSFLLLSNIPASNIGYWIFKFLDHANENSLLRQKLAMFLCEFRSSYATNLLAFGQSHVFPFLLPHAQHSS